MVATPYGTDTAGTAELSQEDFVQIEVIGGDAPPRWTSVETVDPTYIASGPLPRYAVVGRNSSGFIVPADPSASPAILPIGITTDAVVLGVTSRSVAVWRAGCFNLDALRWSAYYTTDILKKRAFEGGFAQSFFNLIKASYVVGSAAPIATGSGTVLPLGPTTAGFTAGAAGGTSVATFTGLQAGETVQSIAPNDGRLAIATGGTALVVGLSTSSAGSWNVTVTTNFRSYVLAVTAAAPTTADPTRYMWGSTRSGPPVIGVNGSNVPSPSVPDDTQLCAVSVTMGMSPDYSCYYHAPILLNWSMANNGATLPETDTGNAVKFEGYSIYYAGTYYPVTVNGQTSWTIPDGGYVICDPVVGLHMTSRSLFFNYISMSVLSGQFMPGGWDKQSSNAETMGRVAVHNPGYLNGTVAVPTSNVGGVNNARPYGPISVLSRGSTTGGYDGRPVGNIFGDSDSYAANDIGIFVPASGVQGFIARAFDKGTQGSLRIPHCHMGVSGSRPSGMSSRGVGQYKRHGEMMDGIKAFNAGRLPFTAIASEHINNDASAFPVTADLQNCMNTYWAFLRSEYGYGVTITQFAAFCATVTDNNEFTTLGGQSARTTDAVAVTGSRFQVSDAYIANKPAILDWVIDQSSIIMDTGLRVWKQTGFSSALAADYVAGTLTCQMTVAPVKGQNIILNAGTTNVTRPTRVSAVSGTAGNYTVTLFTSILTNSDGVSRAQTSGTAILSSVSPDGLHMEPVYHDALADKVVGDIVAGRFGPGAVSPLVPQNTAVPVISGGTSLGSTQSATPGSWTLTPTGYAWQWTRNGAIITGDTGQTRTRVSADAGTSIGVYVVATNGAGPSAPAYAVPIAIPANPSSGHTFDSTTITFDSTSVTFDMT